MKIKILLSLTGCLFALSTVIPLRADRAADLRNEIIPPGAVMHPPFKKNTVNRPAASSGLPGYTPQQMRHAYGFDQLNTTGQGQIIAIVDAYGSSTIQADLNAFCAQFNLPNTTVPMYYPQGQPPVDPGFPDWATESSLDVEWAHAIAPGATIILVAAKSASDTDLLSAVDYAVSLGATQVSMSWAGPEYSTEKTSDFHFNVPGVTFFASSGDNGAGVLYPACSPYVVGVGGTTLTLNSSGVITSETGWSGSGGGVSAFESIPSYQTGWWHGSGRGVPDVSYDADPNTGFPVYLTNFGFEEIGGTSAGAPQWAALCALANSLRVQSISTAPGLLYSLATANYAGYYHDITSGSNGTYSAGSHYDLVTGLGTPFGNNLGVALAGGFSSQVTAPAFSPGAGSYPSGQKVTVVSATPGATIRYTTNGSTPSATAGTLYSGPISISANATIKAIAYESGLTVSPLNSGSYMFLAQVAAPAFSPAAGTYLVAQTVTISSKTSGASIRYTTNGSTPTESIGTLYSGPVRISGTTVLNVIAYKSGFIDSVVASGSYTITPLVVVCNLSSSKNGGYCPYAGLVLASDGNFYGTTQQGGSSDDGVVFKMTPAGVVTTLASFTGANGAQPQAALIQGSDGNFYGTTTGGQINDGSVFKMTPAGVLTTLVKFTGSNGAVPDAALVQGSDGNFYGTTSGGQANNGTVFKITPAGVMTTLVAFKGSNGAQPMGTLLQGHDGNFYGTTYGGGSAGNGTVFKMTPAGVLTTLVAFKGSNGNWPNGAFPQGGLVQGSDGNFYGATQAGGSGNSGTVFKMTPAGAFTSLVSFDAAGDDGSLILAGLIQGRDGNFYGTALAGGSDTDGTVFKVTPAGVLTSYSFNGANGNGPAGGLIQGSDGNLYGTTVFGGINGAGVVFKLVLAP